MRDITLEDTIDIKFTTTEPDTGAPATLSGTPVISAYVGNSVTQITAGITLTVDFDGVTGLNNVRVAVTAANGYTAGTDVALVITTGTVDAVSAVGYKVGEFTIGRGAAFTRLGAPAGASVSADVAAVKVDTAAILVDTGTTLDARISQILRAAVLVDTTIATLATQTSFTLTDGSADDNAYNGMAFIFTDVSTAVQKGIAFASDYTGSTKTVTLEAAPIFTIATTDLVTVVPAGSSTSVPLAASLTGTQTFNMTGNITGNLSGSVGSVTGAVGSVTGAVGSVTGNVGGNVAGSVGSVTGAVGSVTGNVGGNVAGSVASVTGLTASDVGAIKTKTDSLTFTQAGHVDANLQRINDVAITGNGGVGTEFGV